MLCMNSKPNLEELRVWRGQVEESLEGLRRQLAQVQKAIKDSEERLQLLDRLLALERGSDEETRTFRTHTAGRATFLDACVELIRQKREPVHIRELHSSLLDKGIPIPGRGDQANIIARIQRSDGRIIRTGRGMYGLPDCGHPEVKPVRRRKETRSKASERLTLEHTSTTPR